MCGIDCAFPRSPICEALNGSSILVEAQKLGYGLIGVFLNGGVGGFLTHFQYVTNRGVDSSPRVASRAFDFPICHVCVHFFFRFLCPWDEDQCVSWDSYSLGHILDRSHRAALAEAGCNAGWHQSCLIHCTSLLPSLYRRLSKIRQIRSG